MHVSGCADNVKTTCNWRDQDEQLGHTLGVGFIGQVIQGGTSGELEGTKGQQVECYVQGQDARS